MTLRQTIQAAPAKTTELITKLAATSNQALKTRESLFADLSEELTRYVEIEEQHLLPLLRKHPDTKDLATEALKGNKDLRAALAKLAAMPKDNDAFLSELAELNQGFQQHVRNETKELLPAVLKALSDEEAGALAATMEGAVAEAEQAKRDQKREEAAQAKRQAEEAEQAAEAQRAEVRAQRAAEREEKREEVAQAKRQAEEVEQEAEAQRAVVRAQQAAQQAARESTEKVVEMVGRGATSLQDSARQVTITDVGREALARANAVLEACDADWAANVGVERYRLFREVLEEVALGRRIVPDRESAVGEQGGSSRGSVRPSG